MVLLISVEPGDHQRITRAAKTLRRLARNAAAKNIIINAFSHLSENLAEPTESKEVIEELHRRLADADKWELHLTPFGWHKEFDMHITAGQWSQRFIHV